MARACPFTTSPVALLRVVVAQMRKGQSFTSSHIGMILRSIDYIGTFLFTNSTTSFLVGLTQGGTQHFWSSAAVLGPMIVGGAGVAAALVWEWMGAGIPFLPCKVFRSMSANAAYLCGFIQGILVTQGES
jgi:hypothetical protein